MFFINLCSSRLKKMFLLLSWGCIEVWVCYEQCFVRSPSSVQSAGSSDDAAPRRCAYGDGGGVYHAERQAEESGRRKIGNKSWRLLGTREGPPSGSRKGMLRKHCEVFKCFCNRFGKIPDQFDKIDPTNVGNEFIASCICSKFQSLVFN